MFENSYKWKINPEEIRYFNLEKKLAEVRSWDKEKVLIFFGSMTDFFGEFNSFDWIEMWHSKFIEQLPDKQFQIPTKRIGRAMVFYRQKGYVPRNIWIGCSIGAKNRLERIEQLRQIDAKIRWVSFEPLLEDLGDFSLKGIQWAVIGGESDDKHPRPMKSEWAENIRRICERDGVPFFFKQMGGIGGDGAGGNLLNGQKYLNFPKWQANG